MLRYILALLRTEDAILGEDMLSMGKIILPHFLRHIVSGRVAGQDDSEMSV